MLYCDANSGSATTSPPTGSRCVCEKTWGPVHCPRAGTAGKGGRASTGAPGSRSGRYGGGGRHVRNSWLLTPESSVDSWKEGRAGVIQTKWRSSVVGKCFYEAILASPHPWQSPDCIPIVGSVKSLVPSDKRFNHSKVWCTFIFIDLQDYKRRETEQHIYILYVGRQINPLS